MILLTNVMKNNNNNIYKRLFFNFGEFTKGKKSF